VKKCPTNETTKVIGTGQGYCLDQLVTVKKANLITTHNKKRQNEKLNCFFATNERIFALISME
jgi:hypothetical protein